MPTGVQCTMQEFMLHSNVLCISFRSGPPPPRPRRQVPPTLHHLSRRTLQVCCAVPDYKIARKTLQDAAAAGTRFPFRDGFELDKGWELDAATIIDTLGPLMSDDRIARIEQVCARRTFNVLPIIEHP